jgi:hypothetical protein
MTPRFSCKSKTMEQGKTGRYRIVSLVSILFTCVWGSDGLRAGDADPVLWWGFDQPAESSIKDKVTGRDEVIEGNFKYVSGVVGSAMKPDGYTTCITGGQKSSAIGLGSAFTVEAWVAHAAYPWNWVPVISQNDGQAKGFSFNVGPQGNVSLGMSINGRWQQCVSARDVVPLRQWKHLTATYESRSGIRLYVDGKQVGHLDVKGDPDWAGQSPLRSLMNDQKMKPSNIHRQHGTLPGWFSLDGLIDEVKIYNRVLSGKEIKASSMANVRGKSPDLPVRAMPSGPKGPGRFGAYYCKLKYYEEWDNLWPVASDADIVVRFDQSGTRMVFWRGSRYSPAWVSENGLWMADQSVEAFYGRKPKDTEGCFEHMQDRRCRYSHVRVIENTEARVVVHWRYAPVSAHDHLWRENPKTGRACWVDEYYYIYPDQMAVRNVSWKTGTLKGGGKQFQESLAFTQPGQLVSDVVEDEWAELANLKGETRTLKYCRNPDKTKKSPDDLLVQRFNFKSENKPSIIFESGNRMRYVFDRPMGERGLDIPGSCNHWPVGQAACDGRTVQAADRPTHCLGFPVSGPPLHEKDGRSWWQGLYGMTDLSVKDLVFVANGWNNAPALEVVGSGFVSHGYDLGQRAYLLTRNLDDSNDKLNLRVMASETSPVYNPSIIVNGWDQASLTLTIDGKEIKRGQDFRTGVHHTLDGSKVIIWIKTRSTKPMTITLTPT